MIVRILEFRERLRKLYSKTDRYLLAVGKFLVALVGQLEIFYLFAPEQSGIGMLLVQIGLALVCAWFPAGLLTFVYGGTILYTLYGLNVEAFLGAALLIFVLILVLWTVHPGYTWLIALAFLLGLWKVPQPLILLAAMWYTPFVLLPMAAGMVLCGYVHYVATNLYLYQESTLSLKLLLQILEGGLGNIQVYIGILEVALTFLVVYLLRKKEFHHSRPISVFTGGMAYLLIQLMHQLVWEGRGLVLGTELWTTIGSTIVVLLFVIFGYAGDYTRVEYAQFEDDDYYYYVKAVPKISIPEADTKVKTFSSVQQTTEEIPEVIVTDAEGQEGRKQS